MFSSLDRELTTESLEAPRPGDNDRFPAQLRNVLEQLVPVERDSIVCCVLESVATERASLFRNDREIVRGCRLERRGRGRERGRRGEEDAGVAQMGARNGLDVAREGAKGQAGEHVEGVLGGEVVGRRERANTERGEGKNRPTSRRPVSLRCLEKRKRPEESW